MLSALASYHNALRHSTSSGSARKKLLVRNCPVVFLGSFPELFGAKSQQLLFVDIAVFKFI